MGSIGHLKPPEGCEIVLFDRADGVKGHFCVGYRDDNGTAWYWSKNAGFSSFGHCFTKEDDAITCAAALRAGIHNPECPPPKEHASWYDAAVHERVRRVRTEQRLEEAESEFGRRMGQLRSELEPYSPHNTLNS